MPGATSTTEGAAFDAGKSSKPDQNEISMPALDTQGRSVEDSTFAKLQQALAACSLASFVQSLFRFLF